MKLKLFYFMLLFSIIVNAQFTEDFESYSIGSMGSQNPTLWNTWFGNNNANESVIILQQGSSKIGHVYSTSDQTIQTDQILNLGNKATGKWRLNFKMYIAPGKSGYFNIQGPLSANGGFGGAFLNNGVYFNKDNAGPGIGAFQGISFNFPHGVWFDVSITFNNNNKSFKLSINNTLVNNLPTSYNVGVNVLGGIDFFSENTFYHYDLDDFVFEEVFFPDTILIPDANFEQALIDYGLDTNGSGALTGDILVTEAEALTYLNLYNKGITDLTGINGFVNLTSLSTSLNTLGSIDISGLINLESLTVQDCSLTGALDLSANTNLKNLYADNNQVTSVSFSASNLIENINLDSSNLSTIDVTNFGELHQLDVGGNPNINVIDVTQNPKLRLLSLEVTQIVNVNLTQNPLLEYYYHNHVNLTGLDVSLNPLLKEISVYDCQLTALNLTNNLQLERIWMGKNKMTSFDYSIFPNLKTLNLYQPVPGFEFTTIDLSNNLDLEYLTLSYHNIETLDLSSHDKLIQVYMYDNNLTAFSIKNGTNAILQNLNTLLNPNLTCLEVDNTSNANTNYNNGIWYKSPSTSYSENCSSLSTQDHNIDATFKLYPNPVSNVLNIETSQTVIALQLSDINGKTIYKTNQALQQIDMSTYTAGLYFLKIETVEGVSVQKVIKE